MDPKSELRRRLRLVVADVEDALLRSVELWSRLAELDVYVAAATVMAFASRDDEPDTDPLHARLRADRKRLVLPRMEGGRIVPALAGGPLSRGELGVLQPDGPAVPVGELDLVVVPGLAFTSAGVRLGRGKGHYDRFLAGVHAPTIGVCFAEQLCDTLPREPHDVTVGRVLVA